MADPDFDARLMRLFAEAPAFADADGFAQRVENRLDRTWTVRRVLIGAAGLAGGAIAVGQAVGANVFDRIVGFSDASAATMAHSARALSQLRFLSELPVGAEVLWVGAGLAVLAVALMATRSLENF
jgi:hypothetical protein